MESTSLLPNEGQNGIDVTTLPQFHFVLDNPAVFVFPSPLSNHRANDFSILGQLMNRRLIAQRLAAEDEISAANAIFTGLN